MKDARRRSGVPFLDITRADEEVAAEVDRTWADIRRRGGFVGGPLVAEFEAAFASYCGSRHCVGVGNGTDALELVLAGLGIGPGDEVLVPTNTFVATVEAVVAVGARPVFVDVDPDTLLLTAAHVDAAVTAATAAVIVVHLFGQMADVDAIGGSAARAGIAVVEDAAQAHGAAWSGRRAGSVGSAGTFSFYPAKNLGAWGDGGAVVTDDVSLAGKVRSLANHGRSGTHHLHEVAGRNSRLDAIQAAVLSVKLRRLDDWNARRRDAHRRYAELLEGTWCRPVQVDPRGTAVHHLEVVRVADRERAVAELSARDIGWGLHYPIPCHLQPAFARFASGRLPEAERAAREILSLPMSPTTSAQDVERVCRALVDAGTPTSLRTAS